MKNQTAREDIYTRVTNQIVDALERADGNAWKFPWIKSKTVPAGLPRNAFTKHPYRGMNTLIVWAESLAHGWTSNEFATYRQWQEAGAQVRKGETAVRVIYWQFPGGRQEPGADPEDGETESTSSRSGQTPRKSYGVFAREYCVFAREQVDGAAPAAQEEQPHEARILQAEEFFQGIGGTVRHGGNRACYISAPIDAIQMPTFNQFREPEGYYSTLAHEYTHWTSDKSRCDRQLGKRFGTHAYAAEELIAELGAAFTMAHLGLSAEPREDHAQYLKHWLEHLKEDKRAIFTAASKAQQAADYLQHASEAGRKAKPAAEPVAA